MEEPPRPSHDSHLAASHLDAPQPCYQACVAYRGVLADCGPLWGPVSSRNDWAEEHLNGSRND
eukprot:13378965-Alexandrium_andersonii.AAC.1